VEHEFVVLDRPSEVVDQLELLHGISLHAWLEHCVRGLARGLGPVHCYVRIAQQIVHKIPSSKGAIAQGYPDAGRDEHFVAQQSKGRPQFFDDPLRDKGCIVYFRTILE
jgi:hypothetical protein